MKLWKLFLLTCGMTMLLAACNRQRETIPSMDFATYISAYTGGSIASEDAVRIVFAQDMETAEPGKTIEKTFAGIFHKSKSGKNAVTSAAR